MSLLERSPRWLLGVGEALYGAAISARGALYDLGAFKSVRVDRPVISVGNLTAGGNGKTPLVIFLAKKLAKRGAHVAVLSRGYGAPSPPDEATIAADRGTTKLGPDVAGDEPLLIAKKSGASVVIARRRSEAATLAIAALKPDLLLLDDGFQHRALKRDLDLVIVDANEPFDNHHLIPRGRLRESPAALGRANLIVAHRGDAGDPRPLHRDLEVQVEMVIAPDTLKRGPEERPLSWLQGAKIGVIAAIARPERFLHTLELLGAEIVSKTLLPDHAVIRREALETAAKGAELLITTEKDLVRLGDVTDAGGLPLYALAIETRLIRGEEILDQAIEALLEKRGTPSAR